MSRDDGLDGNRRPELLVRNPRGLRRLEYGGGTFGAPMMALKCGNAGSPRESQ